MCGRYVSPDEASIEREFNLVHTQWQFPPSFNVAPTQSVPVVRMLEDTRRGALMRWGLIPFFARGVPPKYSTINARIETVQTAASYRGPWNRGQRIFAFAGLWDVSKSDAGDRIESVTHLTLPANRLLGEIHNTQHRMPAILAKEDREAWLNGSPEEAWSTLKPYADEHLVAWPVSRRINTPKNYDAELVVPEQKP